MACKEERGGIKLQCKHWDCSVAKQMLGFLSCDCSIGTNKTEYNLGAIKVTFYSMRSRGTEKIDVLNKLGFATLE